MKCSFYIAFHDFKVLLIKSFKIQLPSLLFLVVLHQLLHQQVTIFFYNFLFQIRKKDFCHEFSFSNGLTKTPSPLEWPKSTQCDESFYRCFLKEFLYFLDLVELNYNNINHHFLIVSPSQYSQLFWLETEIGRTS